MQRTVKGTKFTYVENTITETGAITAKLNTVVINETDPKRAYRQAVKTLGHNFNPIKTEEHTKLYVLDDEIFFKYAKPVETEAEVNENAEG